MYRMLRRVAKNFGRGGGGGGYTHQSAFPEAEIRSITPKNIGVSTLLQVSFRVFLKQEGCFLVKCFVVETFEIAI